MIQTGCKNKGLQLAESPGYLCQNFRLAMKKIIDILSIVLPALIIILGLVRLFSKNTKGLNSLTMLAAIILLIAGLLRYFAFPDKASAIPTTKLDPIPVSKHSEAFNQSVVRILDEYVKLTNQFASGDAESISSSSQTLKSAMDSLKIEELKVDTLIYQTALQPYENARTELASIIADPSMEEKRGSLNIFSNELFNLLSTVRYDMAKLYWFECPNAFGEGRQGNWISMSEKGINPYGQKDCAELRTTVNFVSADTTKHQ